MIEWFEERAYKRLEWIESDEDFTSQFSLINLIKYEQNYCELWL